MKGKEKTKLQDVLDHQSVPSLNLLMPLLLYPEDRHTGVGAEVTYGAVHHGQVILRNGGHFTQGTWEWSTCKKKLKNKTVIKSKNLRFFLHWSQDAI